MRSTIAATGLDLSGMVVLTEAASGAYGVTPVIAALANAKQVYAFVRTTRYGTVGEVSQWTQALASVDGVGNRISIIEALTPSILDSVDLITNSGHLRPITAEIIDQLPSRAVIALMFEAWEFRASDIDAAACRRKQIPIVGVNENHPAVDVFSYLGPLAVKLLNDAGLPVYRNRIALLCDNGFAEPMLRGLKGAGASVDLFPKPESLPKDSWDAVVVALRPTVAPRINSDHAAHLKSSAPGALIAQFWGDVDRDALASHGVEMWPLNPPTPGHMAILLSAIGPDPIVRLQGGGLRAAELVYRGAAGKADIAQLLRFDPAGNPADFSSVAL